MARIWLPEVRIRLLAKRLADFISLVMSPIAFTSIYKIVGHWMLLVTRVRPVRRAIIESGAPTVIAFIGSVNIITVLATIGLDTRVIVSERNDPGRQRLHAPWQWLRKKLYRWADVVSANSHGALKTLSEYVPPDKLCYLPNPLVPRTDAAARQSGSAGANYFLSYSGSA